MYEIFVKTHFSSAHYLRNYPGKCEFLHGHNWEVTVSVAAEELNEIDVGIDFKELKEKVGQIMKELDHINLNEHPAFQECNPSSERLAQYIFQQLKTKLANNSAVKVYRVTVCETPSSGVTYWEDD